MSGNLSGRPRVSFDFSAAAREHTPEVLAMFLKSLRSSNRRERYSAGTVLLDRALGKPTQPVVGADGDSVAFMHLVAVREIGEKVIAELMLQQTSKVIDSQSASGREGVRSLDLPEGHEEPAPDSCCRAMSRNRRASLDDPSPRGHRAANQQSSNGSWERHHD
jgi:hypothetical protein